MFMVMERIFIGAIMKAITGAWLLMTRVVFLVSGHAVVGKEPGI